MLFLQSLPLRLTTPETRSDFSPRTYLEVNPDTQQETVGRTGFWFYVREASQSYCGMRERSDLCVPEGVPEDTAWDTYY